MSRRLVVGSGVLLACSLLAATVAVGATKAKNRRLSDEDRGAELWKRHCVSCHGPYGRGDGPAMEALVAEVPDLTGRLEDPTSSALVAVVLDGRGAMPAYRNSFDRYDARRVLRYAKLAPDVEAEDGATSGLKGKWVVEASTLDDARDALGRVPAEDRDALDEIVGKMKAGGTVEIGDHTLAVRARGRRSEWRWSYVEATQHGAVLELTGDDGRARLPFEVVEEALLVDVVGTKLRFSRAGPADGEDRPLALPGPVRPVGSSQPDGPDGAEPEAGGDGDVGGP